MRASPSSSSSCNNSHAMTTSLRERLKTIFKKAYELSILCGIEVCVIHYAPNGELNTWPMEIEKVKDMALRYKKATKRKNCLNLPESLKKQKKKQAKDLKKPKNKKKQKIGFIKYPDWYPVFDLYSAQQLSQLFESLQRTLFTLQERFRFVKAAQKQSENTNLSLLHQSLNQSLKDPSRFSLYMYNHGDSTLSQLPLSPSLLNQLTTNYQNHLGESYGFGHKKTNFQHQDFSALLSPQETELMNPNYGLSGFDHNMRMDPCSSKTQDYSALVSLQESGLKNPNYGNPCLLNTQDYLALLSPQESGLKNPNYGDLCLSNTQDYSSALLSPQESGLKNPNYGDLCLSNTQDYSSALLSPQESGLKNPNYGDPCLSNTQDYSSALLSLQESELKNPNYEDLYGFDQNMSMMSDITTNSNVLEHSYEFCSDLQKKNPNYGDMVGSSNASFFSQDMFSSYDDDMSSLNSSLLSNNSRFL